MTHFVTTGTRKEARGVYLHPKDRVSHMLVLGQTGTGKSSLLRTMARQDLDAKQGICLVDPHGDLAEEVHKSHPETHIYWDIADPNTSFGFLPLGDVSETDRPAVVSGLIDTLKKQWEDAWGARMEHLLRYALLALLECGNATLRDIVPMFLNKDFRQVILGSVHDSQVRYFWETEYPAMNYRTSADGIAPIANKLGAFLANPLVRRALCHPENAIHFDDLLRSGKSLIVNLGKGRLGADTANIVGGMIVSAFAHAAYQRQQIPTASRMPYFLYVDEFHSFTTSAFADMLSELRKYGLGLIATTQYTSRLNKDVREAVFGNVGTLISFRTGALEAETISKQFGYDVPSSRDLVNLPNYEMYVKMMLDGVQLAPFSAKTLTS